ncbi:hypothetical protein NGM37_37490, partial [Streptomyces sp. TRM76130]|nr:hypothetical protein [Streptomyces sp. TRM76130]
MIPWLPDVRGISGTPRIDGASGTSRTCVTSRTSGSSGIREGCGDPRVAGASRVVRLFGVPGEDLQQVLGEAR